MSFGEAVGRFRFSFILYLMKSNVPLLLLFIVIVIVIIIIYFIFICSKQQSFEVPKIPKTMYDMGIL